MYVLSVYIVVTALHGCCNYYVRCTLISILYGFTCLQTTLIHACCLATSNIIYTYIVQLVQALRYETPEFTEEYEEEDGVREGEEEKEGSSEDRKKDLSLEATYSEGE